MLFFLIACLDSDGSSQTNYTDNQECEACLSQGKTWQPEANVCTENCAIQEASCFINTCPGSCDEECSYCFDASACMASECTWHQDEELSWCGD